MARYRALAATTRWPLEGLYRWTQQLSLTLLDDIAVLEVTMRSAMAQELSGTYGASWYRRAELFDDDGVLRGKLVAALTFGFWVALLGRGSNCTAA